MAAHKNNTYWLNRKTHGRKPEFTSPKDFEQAWMDYFQWVDTHPWYRNEAIKSGNKVGKIIKIPTKRPYTDVGFCAFHGLGRNYLSQMEKQLVEKPNEDFSCIISWAKGICYSDKFEGAATGSYNPIIIMRDLGLKDSQEITGKDGKDLIPQTKLTPEQIDRLIDKI